MNRIPPLIVAALATVALSAATAGAQVAPPFTYQGELSLDGQPVTDTCDFVFTIYTANLGGSATAGPTFVNGLAVVNGRFSATVTGWPASAWEGDRWMEIGVSCPTGGSLITLSPRRLVTSSPMASLAWSVGADGVSTAALQDGAVTTAKLDTGAVTAGNIAPGAVGGTEIDEAAVQRRVASACAADSSIRAISQAGAVTCEPDDDTTYTAGVGLALVGTEFRAQGSPLAHVVIVAKSGGDFTTIQAAIDSITDAAVDNRYLVFVAPGTYTEQVTLKAFVTLEGSGQNNTVISWTGGSDYPLSSQGSATVIDAGYSTLRRLSVISDGTGQTYAVGVHNGNLGFEMSDVAVTASGDSNTTSVYAVYSGGYPEFNGGLSLHHVTATATNGTYNYAVYSYHCFTTLVDVTARASGGITSCGLCTESAYPEAHDCIFSGGTNSIYFLAAPGFYVKVADSQLDGPVSSGVSCFGTYDTNLDPVTCP